MKKLGFEIEMPSHQKIIDKQIEFHISNIQALPRYPFDCSCSLFHNFFIKPYDNFASEYTNIDLVPEFYNSLRKLITTLKNEIDQIVNTDYKHTSNLTGYDYNLLNDINKIASTVSCHDAYINKPSKVFELCQKAKKLFPINYVGEYENKTYKDYDGEHSYFEGKYAECRSFAALAYCCSIAINCLKTFNGFTEYENPEDDPFFKELINLLLEKAKELNTESMHSSLRDSFEYGFYSEDQFVLNYLFKVMHNISYRHNNENELEKLAFKYYEDPGSFMFFDNYEKMLSETEKCKELNSLIGDAEDFILENIFYCKKL